MSSQRSNARLHQQLTPYYFLLPALLVLAVVILYPVLSNIIMSLHKVRLLKAAGGDEFIGLANYARLLGSATFLKSVSASLRFTLISLPIAFVLGLGLALVFNEIRRYRPVFTAFLLVPWAIAPVVTGYMWR